MRALVPLILSSVMATAAVNDADIARRLARWKPVQMPWDVSSLSERERQVVDKLVLACQQLESAYWRQSDPEGLRLYQTTQDAALKRLLLINGSRYDLIDDDKPFAGDAPYPPGRALCPAGLTREQIEAYVAKHPDQKDAIYNEHTVLRWKGDRLEATPYHVEYRQWMEAAAKLLRDAAKLDTDAAFANFLKARADALLTDDYYASDL